jgi:hypothetical protein
VRLRAFVKASTLLTHRDPKAECAPQDIDVDDPLHGVW